MSLLLYSLFFIELDEFFDKKLKVPSGVLSSNDINYVRRVAATRRAKVQEEVLVSFNSVEARDMVCLLYTSDAADE